MNDLWQRFDDDKSDYLDFQEVKRFVFEGFSYLHGGSETDWQTMFQDKISDEEF